jgi:hypothetical protein
LPFAEVDNCSALEGPVFYKGVLEIVGDPADTWLKPQSWNKGIMWVNGFNLGRYWDTKGPQQAFFTPAPFLKTGSNEVIMLELERGVENCAVKFVDKPDFSGKPPATCQGTPMAGDVVHMQECDSSLPEYMAWNLKNVGTGHVLSLGSLCLGSGPSKDPQSGQPSATLLDCGSAVQFIVKDNQISHGSSCLDITSHGQTPGEGVEWYACQGSSYSGKNQLWDVKDTPAHTQWVVSHMDGKCLSVCPGSRLAPSTTPSKEVIV